MNKALLLSVMTLAFTLEAQAKPLIGRIDKYIEIKNGNVIEIATNEIEDGSATFYDYGIRKKRTIDMSEVSKATREEIAGVKAGEMILVETRLDNVRNVRNQTVSRYCEVFYLFENKQAYAGCKSSEADRIPGYQLPARFDFIINNVENVTAEVESLDGFTKGETAELSIETRTIKAGKNVRILAIFANGEALVQKDGFSRLDTSGILHKSGVERINLVDLSKL